MKPTGDEKLKQDALQWLTERERTKEEIADKMVECANTVYHLTAKEYGKTPPVPKKTVMPVIPPFLQVDRGCLLPLVIMAGFTAAWLIAVILLVG